MNITVLTAGSRGDIQPLLALCIELRRNGHSVLVASHSNFRGFVEKTATPFISIMANHQDWLATESGVKWIETGSSMIGFFKGLKNFFEPVLEDMFRGSIEACQGADLILFSSLAVSAPHVAEKFGIPCIPIQLQPIYPTSEFPSFAAPWKKGELPILNRFTHWIGEFIMGSLTRKQLNRWRRRELQLRPMPFAGMGLY
ncbi:MAG TPA: glycosyltransferase [Verrucomicrobiales bacterium]|nr:glycosyltransferase [Verrucomicrobiales bacterium]HIL69204.1 glycosyltransferase [Verrucomicrobiota bacterium]